jgi:CheY-like chemotaxis protein
MRRIYLRESIHRGMTSCRRDKLGLGLSLLYHLVGAQGSDLRYEIVREQQRHDVVSMTKFWFLLPMSLDFPDRLPAEQIVIRDGSHGVNPQGGQPLSIPLPVRSPIALAPSMLPGDGLGKQQPRQKRAKLSHSPVPVDTLNSIIGDKATPPAFAESSSFSSVLTSAASSGSAPLKSNELIDVAAADMDIASTKQYPGISSGARPLVLVVEDTDVSASLLCMHLRKLGCTSHRAENGEVAIEMLRSAPTPNMYSLVLMDLRMPVMDGFEATTIIKGHYCNIPIVALTGESSEEIKRRCDEIGFDDYKTKPLKRPQLEELLHKFVPGYNT